MKNRILFVTFAVFSLLILFNACAEQTAHGQRTFAKANGEAVVKNSLEPLNPELQIIFEEDLTIGVKEGDENYMFGNLVFLNTDDEGNFYVSDGNRNNIKKYDSNGIILQTIGREGQGPGEFQEISVVRFDGERNMYLNDIQNHRISFLSQDGNYIQGIRTPTVFEGLVINSRGFYIAKYADNVELGNSKKWDYVYGLFDDKFNLTAEFLRLPQEAGAGKKGVKVSMAQMYADFLSDMAFVPVVNYALDENDLLYFGYPDSYEIKVYSNEGKLQRIIQREFEPVEIKAKDKENFEQNLSGQLMSKLPPSEHKNAFELIKYPRYKPAYERFTLMENGWIFIVVDSLGDERKLVDIFSKDGEYLAQFETDISIDELSFNNGKAYAVATIDDYKFIKRYNFEILGYGDN